MSPDNKPLLKWFGYSRRERRSTFVLFIIIVMVIALRYAFPERKIKIEDISASLTTLSETLLFNNEVFKDTVKSFMFNPDKVRNETLKSPGPSDKKAGKLKKYSVRVGRFRQSSGYSGINSTDKNLSEGLTRYDNTEQESVSASENGSIQLKMIDLNNCDSILLDRLPGIGPVLSVRIIKYRNLLGGFISTEQLKEVYGLSEETYTRIAERVYADSSVVKQININVAGFKDLIKHPYFERYDVQAILKYRELKGRISSLEELTDNKILTPEKAKRIGQYLFFGK